jgi:hypothetical protein
VGKASGERARPIKVIMSSMSDKQILLGKNQLLRGSHFFLDEDLTIRQQEERKEELLKVRQQGMREKGHGCSKEKNLFPFLVLILKQDSKLVAKKRQQFH